MFYAPRVLFFVLSSFYWQLTWCRVHFHVKRMWITWLIPFLTQDSFSADSSWELGVGCAMRLFPQLPWMSFDVHVELFMCCSLGPEQWALTALLQSAWGERKKAHDIRTDCHPAITIRDHRWSYILVKYLSSKLIHTNKMLVWFFLKFMNNFAAEM